MQFLSIVAFFQHIFLGYWLIDFVHIQILRNNGFNKNLLRHLLTAIKIIADLSFRPTSSGAIEIAISPMFSILRNFSSRFNVISTPCLVVIGIYCSTFFISISFVFEGKDTIMNFVFGLIFTLVVLLSGSTRSYTNEKFELLLHRITLCVTTNLFFLLNSLFKNDLRQRVKQARSLAHSGWFASNPAPHSWSLAAAQVGHPLQISVVVSPLSQHFGIYNQNVNYLRNDYWIKWITCNESCFEHNFIIQVPYLTWTCVSKFRWSTTEWINTGLKGWQKAENG